MTNDIDDETPVKIGHDILLDPDKVDQDLHRLYRSVIEKATEAINYYKERKPTKRIGARAIRFFAVVLFSLAGLVPLVDSTSVFDDDPPIIVGKLDATKVEEAIKESRGSGIDSGQVALLFAAVAAALLGMDKFFGLSSTWTRFVSAELSLERSLDRFQMDWALANVSLKNDDEERKRPIDRVQLLKEFSMEISQINEDETKVWISEYQTALAALERSVKERQEALRPGSLHLTIQRGSKVQGVCKVLLDGQEVQETGGDSLAIRRVPPGPHDVQVVGKDPNGQDVKVGQMVTVPSGGVAPITMTLS